MPLLHPSRFSAARAAPAPAAAKPPHAADPMHEHPRRVTERGQWFWERSEAVRGAVGQCGHGEGHANQRENEQTVDTVLLCCSEIPITRDSSRDKSYW